MKIKIIASKPADKGQGGIENIIGKTFNVIRRYKNGSVQVHSLDFHGNISVNKGEYRRLHVKSPKIEKA